MRPPTSDHATRIVGQVGGLAASQPTGNSGIVLPPALNPSMKLKRSTATRIWAVAMCVSLLMAALCLFGPDRWTNWTVVGLVATALLAGLAELAYICAADSDSNPTPEPAPADG